MRVEFSDIRALEDVLLGLRQRLDAVFARDTAHPDSLPTTPSAGHCAAVALIVQSALGGELVSTVHRDESHWFNRLRIGTGVVDVDLTGDQFGFAPVRLSAAGGLFPNSHVRGGKDVADETIDRARLLARRASLEAAVRTLEAEARRRSLVIARPPAT